MLGGGLRERGPELDYGVRSDPEGIPVPRPPAFVDDRSRSDLERWPDGLRDRGAARARLARGGCEAVPSRGPAEALARPPCAGRSEERRVGKECRSRWW